MCINGSESKIDPVQVCGDLWDNARDSINHAMYHFSEMAPLKATRLAHHTKWAILSVHHAAECFCNMTLLELDPNNPRFKIRQDSLWFPSLSSTVKQLLTENLVGRISLAERRLFELFKHLVDIRHQIIHRTLPANLDASVSAISLLGLLRMIRRRVGESAPEVVRWADIEGDVFEAIHWERHDEYFQLASSLVQEEYSDRLISYCPNCGTDSVVDSRCEVCFEDMDSIECHKTGMTIYYPSWQTGRIDPIEVECPFCECVHSLASDSK